MFAELVGNFLTQTCSLSGTGVQTQSGPKPRFEAQYQPDHQGNLTTPTMNTAATTMPRAIAITSPRLGGGNHGHHLICSYLRYSAMIATFVAGSGLL